MVTMDTKAKVNYIIMDDTEDRSEILLNQFSRNGVRHIGTATYEQTEEYDEPYLHGSVRFDYSLDELEEIAGKYGLNSNKNQFRSFVLQAVQYCGVRIGDEEAMRYVKTISGFETGFRYYRIAGLLGTTRFTVRVVPSHWTGRASTNFVLQGSKIWIEDFLVGELGAVFTGSSIYNLSYITENQKEEMVLSINPFQKCAQHCKFCFKGTRAMLPTLRDSLINLSAEEIVRLLEVEYPELDYSGLTELVLLTARFGTLNQLLLYLEKLYKGIKIISKGAFDPNVHDGKRIKISTHLISTIEDMKKVEKFGVRRYIYPVEIFNDTLRQKYMSSQFYRDGNNKGDISIDRVYKSLSDAKQVFGEEVEPVVILGIDNFDDTINGIAYLKKIGMSMLTHNIFRVYDSDQMEMYHMSLEEIIETQILISQNFESPFRQRITKDLPKYHEKYRDI